MVHRDRSCPSHSRFSARRTRCRNLGYGLSRDGFSEQLEEVGGGRFGEFVERLVSQAGKESGCVGNKRGLARLASVRHRRKKGRIRFDQQAVLRYRDLLQVEELFRTAKTLLRTRPIHHSCDEALRGHVFCSFLALVLRKELQGRWEGAAPKPEWGDLLRDLDRLQEATLEQDGKTWRLRTEATGTVPPLLKILGIALPPRVQATGPPATAPPTTPRKRRGRPRRGATCA